MKKFYKFLDIPNHKLISDKLYEYTVTHTSVLQCDNFVNPLNVADVYRHIPELEVAITDLGLTAFQILMLQTVSDNWFDGRIHVDTGNAAAGARMIWPVHNCENSETRFYNIDRKYLELSKLPDGYHAELVTIPGPYDQIDVYTLTGPAIIDTQIPHGVFCNWGNTDRRLAASFTFTMPPDHLLEI